MRSSNCCRLLQRVLQVKTKRLYSKAIVSGYYGCQCPGLAELVNSEREPASKSFSWYPVNRYKLATTKLSTCKNHWFPFTQTDQYKFYFIEWLTFHNWEATHKYITSESLSLLQYITAEFPIRDSIRDLVCDPIRSNPGGISYSVIFFVLIIAFYERISSSRYVTISDSLWIRNDRNLIH